MNETLLRSWWMLALRGAVACAFGVLALAWPGLTLLSLAILFAAYALLGGAVWVFGAIGNRERDDHWWVILLIGLVSVGAGAIAAMHPALTALVLILLMGAHACVTGVLEVLVAVRLRRFIRGESMLVLSGVASILFGAIVFMYPSGAGALALVWLIGLYAIVTGILLLALALRVRKWARTSSLRSVAAGGGKG
ncbi:MAG: HdeD family acid-resistance protein [Pseudomonadota bacterium]